LLLAIQITDNSRPIAPSTIKMSPIRFPDKHETSPVWQRCGADGSCWWGEVDEHPLGAFGRQRCGDDVGAPGVDPRREESLLDDHYGMDSRPEARPEAGMAAARTGADDAMTRSEEEVKVGTRKQEVGRVRLRKWVETENVTKTVPVKKEKVRIEREPITDANRDKAMDGPEITEGEHEITLSEEEVVVEKRTLPKGTSAIGEGC
jgi:uncharacterized protein (TIGR02271 family)